MDNSLIDFMVDADVGQTKEVRVDHEGQPFDITVIVTGEDGIILDNRIADLTVSHPSGGKHTETIYLSTDHVENSLAVYDMVEHRMVEDGFKEPVPSFWSKMKTRLTAYI